MSGEHCDLVLRGGEVFDPPGRKRFRSDVAITNGGIVAVGLDLPTHGARVVDVSGALIGPGWVDTHTHIFRLFKPSSLDADSIGVEQGVVVLLDAGSCGAANAAAFQEYVVRPAKTRVYGLLHISRHGNMHAPGESEIVSWLDVDAAVRTIDQHRAWIRGVKVRASATAVGALGILPVVLAKKAATEAGVPLMAHVGNAPPTLDEVCRLFEAGDVITHCYHGKAGGLLSRKGDVAASPAQGRSAKRAILPAALEAVARGVRLDVGHGSGSFSQSVCREALAQGLQPFHISTDLHAGNVAGPVHSLALTMSKLLDLGMDLYDVVAAASLQPAQTFGVTEIGPVAVGAPANLSIFRVVEREQSVRDSYGSQWTISRVIEPCLAVVDGVAYPALRGATQHNAAVKGA